MITITPKAAADKAQTVEIGGVEFWGDPPMANNGSPALASVVFMVFAAVST